MHNIEHILLFCPSKASKIEYAFTKVDMDMDTSSEFFICSLKLVS